MVRGAGWCGAYGLAVLLGLGVARAGGVPAAPGASASGATAAAVGAGSAQGAAAAPSAGGVHGAGEAGGPASAPLAPQGGAPSGGGPSHVLAFVVESTAQTADHGLLAGAPSSALGWLGDLDVAQVLPGHAVSARRLHAEAEWCAVLGDEDGDGDFWDAPGGEIDALARRPDAPAQGTPQLEHWLLSTEQPFGLADPGALDDEAGALDGTLFSLVREPDGSLRVQRFLREELLLRCLGQGDDPELHDVDVDALAVDAAGNLYLSFRSTEAVGTSSVTDDGVVCIPVDCLALDFHGEVGIVTTGCARVVFDKPQADAMLEQVGLVDAEGDDISILADLTGLAIDPAGGTFTPLEPVESLPDGVPHLLFTGTRLGPTVLSTRDGGSLARLNGAPLGAQVVDGAPLGLAVGGPAAVAADLAAIHVEPLRPQAPVLHVAAGELHFYYEPQGTLLLDGFAPGGAAWLLFDGWLPAWGETSHAVPWTGAGASQLHAMGTGLQLGVPVDGLGRARLVLPPAGAPGVSLRVAVQALELGSGRLSRPATFWYANGGPLAPAPPSD